MTHSQPCAACAVCADCARVFSGLKPGTPAALRWLSQQNVICYPSVSGKLNIRSKGLATAKQPVHDVCNRPKILHFPRIPKPPCRESRRQSYHNHRLPKLNRVGRQSRNPSGGMVIQPHTRNGNAETVPGGWKPGRVCAEMRWQTTRGTSPGSKMGSFFVIFPTTDSLNRDLLRQSAKE